MLHMWSPITVQRHFTKMNTAICDCATIAKQIIRAYFHDTEILGAHVNMQEQAEGVRQPM